MIYTLDLKEQLNRQQVGGKGLALMETTGAGFNVPEGFVLSVEFFQPWLDEVKSSPAFDQIMVEVTKENCDRLVAMASKLVFTEKQKDLFQEHMNQLKGDVYAIRSSSPEEDLEGISFAGMYETLLGQPKEMIDQSIAKVFASCFDYRVMSYKSNQGMDLTSTAIAVIIQRQLDPEVSGVGFSINPLNNAYDEVMINASFGLGEAIVSGLVTPDTYIYDAVAGKIIEKQVKAKVMRLVMGESGTLNEVANDNEKVQALADEKIEELAKLIKDCESYYHQPIDTEWAMENDQLYLLQARPITTHFPLYEELMTKQGEPKRFYIDMLMLTQGIRKPLSIQGMDVWKKLIFITKSGLLSTEINGTAPMIGGKEYLSITAYQKVLGKKNGRKALETYDGNIRKIVETIDLDAHAFEGKPEGTDGYIKRSLGKAFGMIPELMSALLGKEEKIVAKYLVKAEEYNQVIQAQTTENPYHLSVDRIMDGFEDFMGSLAPILSGMIMQKNLEKMLKGKVDDGDLAALNMELAGNPTCEMGHKLHDIAKLDAFKAIQSKDAFIEAYENDQLPKTLFDDIHYFEEHYGFRGIREIDVATKRVTESPEDLYDILSSINTEENQHSLVEAKREEAYNRLLEVARTLGKEKKFVKAASRLKATFGYREYPKYMLVKGIAKLHHLSLEIGEDLTDKGRLGHPYEIFDLTVEEVSQAQKDPRLDLQELRRKNLEVYEKRTNIKEWPLVIDSRGKIHQPSIAVSDGDIVGDSIAPGKVTGRVKVLLEPYEKEVLPGEILVTRATEPSWTPIFTNAAGVVMEIGGPLQHGGIIAREYGIPCVSGLLGITSILKDGDLIEVDGSRGVIKVLEQ